MKLESMHADDVALQFELYKESLFETIDATFGWDEAYQRERFLTRYEPHWFYWAINDRGRCGVVCYREGENSIHVHLVLVMKPLRYQGYGKAIMQLLHEEAASKGKNVTLSSFKKDHAARRFYQSLGYQVLSEDDAFMELVWKFNTSP